MARVKGGTVTRARRKKILKMASGYFGSKHLLFKTAKEQVLHSLNYAFNDRRKLKSDYRKFKIRTVQGPNDYASLKEVLTRRFEHGLREKEELERKHADSRLGSFTNFPDLIMMDGGRGQVSVAEEVMEELQLEIPVCGNVGGGIWQAAADSVDRVRVTTQPDEHGQWTVAHDIKEIVGANDGNGYGWSRLMFEPIIITKPNTIVSYGVATDPEFTGQTWLGQWFSACDFVIERIEE